MEMRIENQKRNQKSKIQKVNLTIENEFYTIEECKIITPMNETENAFTPGMMLYEKSEIKKSKRLYLEDESAQVFVTRMIDRKDFDNLFQIKHYVEGHVLQGESNTQEAPILFSDSAVKQIKTYRGLSIQKRSADLIFKSQGDTVYQTAEGDFYIGHFTEGKTKKGIYIRKGSLTDCVSVWSIKAAAIAKAEYQKACEKTPYLDNDGNLILSKWKEFLKNRK